VANLRENEKLSCAVDKLKIHILPPIADQVHRRCIKYFVVAVNI